MLLALLLGCSAPETPIEFYFVRHAEKDLTVKKDPPLKPAGEARALALAEQLADAGITSVHSTDTLRTRSTGAPTARVFQVKLETYDGREPKSTLDDLKVRPGVHLVVGHSNTTPELVKALGGEPGTMIDEEIEYNRLYHVVLDGEEPVQTKLTTYGAPNPPVPPPVELKLPWAPGVKAALSQGNSIESPIGYFVPTPDGVMFRASTAFTAQVRNHKDKDLLASGLRNRWVRIEGLGVLTNKERLEQPAKGSLLKASFELE